MSMLRVLFERFNTPLELRRGEATLTAQPFRIESTGTSGQSLKSNSLATSASKASVVLVALPGTDIKPEDRFSWNGSVFVVVTVKPPSFVAPDLIFAFADLRQ